MCDSGGTKAARQFKLSTMGLSILDFGKVRAQSVSRLARAEHGGEMQLLTQWCTFLRAKLHSGTLFQSVHTLRLDMLPPPGGGGGGGDTESPRAHGFSMFEWIHLITKTLFHQWTAGPWMVHLIGLLSL